MDELGLFTAALGLSGPWRVTRSEFDAERTQLDLYLDFERGARFGCPAKDCAEGACPVHDTADKTWRHMDFFQHKALLHARLPRVCCPEHGVRQVSVSWARPGSGFSIAVRGAGVDLRRGMPVSKVAQLTREHDTRIWRVLEHHVRAARDNADACVNIQEHGEREDAALAALIAITSGLLSALLNWLIGKDNLIKQRNIASNGTTWIALPPPTTTTTSSARAPTTSSTSGPHPAGVPLFEHQAVATPHEEAKSGVFRSTKMEVHHGFQR